MTFILLGEFSAKNHPLGGYVRKQHWGRMWGRDHPHESCPQELWGLDNGAWPAYVNGRPFDGERFKRRIEVAVERMRAGSCVVAAVPDIVAGGNESLRFSLGWLDTCRKLGPRLPWLLVVQDGMERIKVRKEIRNFDGLFLGGTDEFKKQAYHFAELAHVHGKKFHYGRASSVAKLRAALGVGADSLDSATPVISYSFGLRSGRERARRWLEIAAGNDPQQTLF